VVHDFRYDDERDRSPTALGPDVVEHVALPIGGAAAEHVSMLDQILAGEITSVDDSFMGEMYVSMLDNDAPTFGRLLASLSGPDRLPALFHCTAGKDRTGIAAALLLSVLGVADDVVLDDYELTNRYRAARRIEELRPALADAGVDVEDVRSFLSAPRLAMETALSHLRRRYGSVEAYLLGPAGVDGEALTRLRRRLVSP
jgi:protein-tyrosine phosphatase